MSHRMNEFTGKQTVSVPYNLVVRKILINPVYAFQANQGKSSTEMESKGAQDSFAYQPRTPAWWEQCLLFNIPTGQKFCVQSNCNSDFTLPGTCQAQRKCGSGPACIIHVDATSPSNGNTHVADTWGERCARDRLGRPIHVATPSQRGPA